MSVTLTIDDLEPFAPNLSEDKANLMIADAMALAVRVAPCIADDTLSPEDEAAAVAILRGAILRWNDQGTGEGPALVAGVFQMTPKSSEHRSLLFPTEIKALTALCGSAVGRKAYMVDMIPADDAV